MDLIVPPVSWPEALERAATGDVSLLTNTLRHSVTPLDDPEARRFFADLIEGRVRISQRGPRPRIDEFAADMIRLLIRLWDLRHSGAKGRPARARYIEDLANHYHCTPGRIREIESGRK